MLLCFIRCGLRNRLYNLNKGLYIIIKIYAIIKILISAISCIIKNNKSISNTYTASNYIYLR